MTSAELILYLVLIVLALAASVRPIPANRIVVRVRPGQRRATPSRATRFLQGARSGATTLVAKGVAATAALFTSLAKMTRGLIGRHGAVTTSGTVKDAASSGLHPCAGSM
jgi:hypothetical protein